MGPAQAAEPIGWQEAVARLAGERTKAETCARLLKQYGDPAAIGQGELTYGDAKGDVDAVIAGLTVALVKDDQPTSLPDLEARLQQGVKGRETVCAQATPLVPKTSGEKGFITDLVSGALEPLIGAVKEIYLNYRKGVATGSPDPHDHSEPAGGDEMARLRRYCFPALIAVLALAGAPPARAEDAPEPPAGLYDRPVLVLDPGMHTAHHQARRRRRRGPLRGDRLRRQDSAGLVGRRRAAAADDPRARRPGRRRQDLRGRDQPGRRADRGRRMDGARLSQPEQIYLFDRDTGDIIQRIEGLPNVVNHLTFSPDGRRLAATLGGAMASASTVARRAGPRSPGTPTTATRATGPTSRPMAAWRRPAMMAMCGSTMMRCIRSRR